MEIRYKNSLEDLVAFHKYHYSNSDTFKKQKKRATIYMPIISCILMVALFLITHEMKIILWGSLFIVVYIFLIHRAYKTGMSKAVRRLYEEQDSKGSICEHVVQISEEGIFEKTDVNERKDKWFGVQRIA